MRLRFLNVDLELAARGSLAGLLDAWGERVVVLRDQREAGAHSLSLELAADAASAEAAIAGLCALVEALEPAARQLWDGCELREFDAGYDAEPGAQPWSAAIAADALARIAALGATLRITVYPPPATTPSDTPPPD